MVFFTSQLAMVVKNLKGGGRMWNKPWGAKRMSRAQKLNRRADALRADRNRRVLREAALLEPEVGSSEAVRLERPLAAWRQQQMAGHVARAKRALENGGLVGAGVVVGAGALGGSGGGVGRGAATRMVSTMAAGGGGGLSSISISVASSGARQYGSVAAAAAAVEASAAAAAAAGASGQASAWAALRRAMTTSRR